MLTLLLTDGEFTGLIRSLRAIQTENIRIIGLTMNPYLPHSALLDASYLTESVFAQTYIDNLISILQKEKVDIILPIVSEGLESLMSAETEIKEKTGAVILSSCLDALRIANDKISLYDSIQSSRIDDLSEIVPKYQAVYTKQVLLETVDQFVSKYKKICIKKARGENAEGFWIIDNESDHSDMLFHGNPRRHLSLNSLHDMMQDLNPGDLIPPYIVSEYLPGEEWDCDILCMDGKIISITTRINFVMHDGLTSVLETRDQPQLKVYCEKIVALLHLSYIVCISFRADVDGHFRLLEINPRIMGNIYVSTLAGNNYVEMAIRLLQKKPIHPVPAINGICTAMYYDQIEIKPQKE